VGDVITVTWTLTAYSDPASFSSIDIAPDLLSLTGPLPTDLFIDVNASVPEPGTPLLIASGLIAIWWYRRRAA
jgi:hypothetical protein